MSVLAGRRHVAPDPRLKRVALVSLMAVVTVNIWTGGPLLALWIGSRVQGEGPPSMLAVGVAAVSLGRSPTRSCGCWRGSTPRTGEPPGGRPA